ncbi:hypothetical protein HDU97_010155 [Phlyctochytrium planicorne]|nr:hypothetical protein HDU97_010155 [Phlyctochytrium planicorne]
MESLSEDEVRVVQQRQALAASFLSSIPLFEDESIEQSGTGKRPQTADNNIEEITRNGLGNGTQQSSQSPQGWRFSTILKNFVSPKSSPRNSTNVSRNRFGSKISTEDLDVIVIPNDDEQGSQVGSLSNIEDSSLTATSLQQLQLQQAMQTPGGAASEYLVSRGPSSSIFGFASAFRDRPFQTVADISMEAINNFASISRMSVSGGRLGSSSRNFGKNYDNTPTRAITDNRQSVDNEYALIPASKTNLSGQPPFILHLVSGKLLSNYVPSDTRSKFLQEKLVGAKVTFATSSGVPMSFFSVIPYVDGSREKTKRVRALSLFGSQALISQTLEYSNYNPYFLDDPELKTGKSRKVITLPCFMASIIQYSRAADIKKELNEHFRDNHPTVDPTLTLSQIRSLKSKMMDVGNSVNLELSTVASAYVFFEKLVLKNFVSKSNRKLTAACCLLLAAKVNDPKETNYGKVLEAIEKILEITRREVYQHEFVIYAELEFNLFLPLWEILPHLDRVIEASEYNSVDEYCEGRTFFSIVS